MSIPDNIVDEATALQAQVAAATPLENATFATLTAIRLNANQLATDIGNALTAAAGALDTWMAPTDPVAIANGVLALATAAADQNSLANMQGYVGRSVLNLNNV
jgi:hypothetical protein